MYIFPYEFLEPKVDISLSLKDAKTDTQSVSYFQDPKTYYRTYGFKLTTSQQYSVESQNS